MLRTMLIRSSHSAFVEAAARRFFYAPVRAFGKNLISPILSPAIFSFSLPPVLLFRPATPPVGRYALSAP